MPAGLLQRDVVHALEAVWREHAADTPSLVPDLKPDADALAEYPEIAFLRGRVPRSVLESAVRRAEAIGVSPDRVLICTHAIDEEMYLRLLCSHHGFVFEILDDKVREDCAQDNERLCEATRTGMLQLRDGDNLVVVVAPQLAGVRGLLDFLRDRPGAKANFRFTTTQRLNRFVARHVEVTLGNRASRALHERWPSLSAAPPRWRQSFLPTIVAVMFSIAALAVAPGPVLLIFEVMLAAVFIAWMILRMVGTLVGWPQYSVPTHVRDDQLPVYTIMCALCREAAAVKGLVAALRSMDYPGIRAQTPQDISPVIAT